MDGVGDPAADDRNYDKRAVPPYAILGDVRPTLVLNCILLPLNLYRLNEMRTLIRKVERARAPRSTRTGCAGS